ncbi:MAG: Bacterial like protein, partial [Actinomycetota bacterium]
GRVEWGEATGSGRLRASGERSDLSGLLPLI